MQGCFVGVINEINDRGVFVINGCAHIANRFVQHEVKRLISFLDDFFIEHDAPEAINFQMPIGGDLTINFNTLGRQGTMRRSPSEGGVFGEQAI
jgi:hypothetical protein